MLTWIKTHPAQAAVVALSFSLAASSVELYRGYSATRLSKGAHDSRLPATVQIAPEYNSTPLDHALTATQSPQTWNKEQGAGRLFASKPLVNIKGKLQTLEGKTFRPPVPNDWLMKYGLDPMDPNVLGNDPDQDGFTTLQEWEGLDAVSHLDDLGSVVKSNGRDLGDDSTSPIDPKFHPDYHTRLALERVEQIPFHLRFLTHDVDTKNPKRITVQINATPGRTEFVEVGQSLKHAPVDVRSYTRKEVPGPDGTTKDVSEVIVVDRRTGQEVTLPKGQVVNSPDSYAILRYDWKSPKTTETAKTPMQFRLRKNETFRLPPEDHVYRVVEIRADAVDLTLPTGAIYTVHARKSAK